MTITSYDQKCTHPKIVVDSDGWARCVFCRATVNKTPFSDFIRNASLEEKGHGGIAMTEMAIRLDPECGPYMEEATEHQRGMAAQFPDQVRIVDLPDHVIEAVRRADHAWRSAQKHLAEWFALKDKSGEPLGEPVPLSEWDYDDRMSDEDNKRYFFELVNYGMAYLRVSEDRVEHIPLKSIRIEKEP